MYEILDNSNLKWDELVKLYNLDVYFAPQYCKIWEDYGDGETQAFLYENSLILNYTNFILQSHCINNLSN